MPAVTASSHLRSNGGASSLTWAHVSDGNPLLVLTMAYPTPASVGVTFNGVPVSQVAFITSGGVSAWIHALYAPAAVSANIVVTPSSAASDMCCGAWSVSGADLNGIVQNFVQVNGSGTAPSGVVASAVGNLVVDFVMAQGVNANFTTGAGQTQIYAENGVASSVNRSASSSEAGAVSVTMSWTLSVASAWFVWAFSIPAPGTVINTARVTKTAIDVVQQQPLNPIARVTKSSIDVLQRQTMNPSARVTKTSIDVLQTQGSLNPVARVSKTSIDVLILQGPSGGETVSVVWQ